MRKFFLSTSVIIAFVFYTLATRAQNFESARETALKPPALISPSDSPTVIPTTVPTKGGQYRDGSYTGDSVNAFYGNVQVRVTISGGKITDVQFLDYPHDRNTSVEINSQAMPYLQTEAIQAQNANVDIVSGATQTSLAFRQSLQSALNQAQ